MEKVIINQCVIIDPIADQERIHLGLRLKEMDFIIFVAVKSRNQNHIVMVHTKYFKRNDIHWNHSFFFRLIQKSSVGDHFWIRFNIFAKHCFFKALNHFSDFFFSFSCKIDSNLFNTRLFNF